MKKALWVIFGLALSMAGCAPPIYVIDRPSLLEMESGGSFPDMEQDFLEKQESFGPKMAPRSEIDRQKFDKRDYNLLQGEVLKK